MMPAKVTPEECNGQDWDRLRQILAPILDVDYSFLSGPRDESMTAEDFIAFASGENMLGSSLIDTQHLIGASKYSWISETVVQGAHQVRAAHQKYTDSTKATVEAKGHGHALVYIKYTKAGGEWKLCGIKPTMYWSEYNIAKIWGHGG
ncbi:Scytalone dehydratase arp1 [Metarhizium anisopliae]|nr:Scytalone dehydratase arp1 [Metarhizium anisopliae]